MIRQRDRRGLGLCPVRLQRLVALCAMASALALVVSAPPAVAQSPDDELGLPDVGPPIAEMSEGKMFAALAADGKLIKRPILKAGEEVLVGFRETDYADLFAR